MNINPKKATKAEVIHFMDCLSVCNQSMLWLTDHEYSTSKEAWDDCDRADWMMWLLKTMAKHKMWPSRKDVLLLSCDCVEFGYQYLPRKEKTVQKIVNNIRELIEKDIDIKSNVYFDYFDYFNKIEKAFKISTDCVLEGINSGIKIENQVDAAYAVSSACNVVFSAKYLLKSLIWLKYTVMVFDHMAQSMVYSSIGYDMNQFNTAYFVALKELANFIRERIQF